MKHKLRMYLCALYHIQKKLNTSDPFGWTSHAITIQLISILLVTEMVALVMFFPDVIEAKNPIYLLVLVPLSIVLGNIITGDEDDLVSYYNENIDEINEEYIKVVGLVFCIMISYFLILLAILYFSML